MDFCPVFTSSIMLAKYETNGISFAGKLKNLSIFGCNSLVWNETKIRIDTKTHTQIYFILDNKVVNSVRTHRLLFFQ